ncbi:MAG: response regulator transcription factor [Bacteroidota bacterium]|jgi:DNA-binding NarL/FixJ family response regulator|nr:response regulator transcription factor [Bacteroidota bacterium]
MVTESKRPGKKVLIVEDHPIVSDSLFRLINDTFENTTCVHAGTGTKGLSYLNGNHFDIILLDINLPDMSGIEFCSQARSRFPELKILVVTSLAQRHVIDKAIQSGVMGFVLKTSDVRDITEGIMQVMDGKTYFGLGVKDLMDGHTVSGSSEPVITKRESEILKLIADGFTNQEIADRLFISSSTVDSHRKNLLVKFNSKNTAALVKTAISKGII